MQGLLPPQRVGHAVRVKMRAGKISQQTLAAHLSLSQQAVSRRLTNRVDFRSSELVVVAELLGTTVDALTGEAMALAESSAPVPVVHPKSYGPGQSSAGA